MGLRGPPKKPTALKRAQGQRERQMPEGEILPPVETNPQISFDLSPRAEEIFKDVAKRLQSVGLLTVLDKQTVLRYCELFDQFLIYREQLNNGNPMEIETTQMGPKLKPNPALKPYLELARELLVLEKQFGMTPAARASLAHVMPNDDPKAKTKSKLYEKK